MLSRVQLCHPVGCTRLPPLPPRLLRPWDYPGRNTGVGCHFILQEIFPTQELNPGLPHRRWILYHLSHRGSCFLKQGWPEVTWPSSVPWGAGNRLQELCFQVRVELGCGTGCSPGLIHCLPRGLGLGRSRSGNLPPAQRTGRCSPESTVRGGRDTCLAWSAQH